MKSRTLLAFTICALAPAGAQPGDSLSLRIERMRGMAAALTAELDSLQRDLAGRKPEATAETSNVQVTQGKPLIGELLTDRERKLAEAATVPFFKTAVGYTFDPVTTVGMHAVTWSGHWGLRASGTARFNGDTRLAGADVMLLRGLHRFSLFEGLQTHLYAFAGAGIFWRRKPFQDVFPGIAPPGPPPPQRAWYETPDIPLRAEVGAGTELNLFSLGGLRATPEIGFQAADFLSRYQDSESWKAQKRDVPGFADRPKSDVSLDAYAAFHLSFYFR